MPSPIPSNVNDKQLYARIKKKIKSQDVEAGRAWGAYSSGRLVSEYKRAGGTYSGSKPRSPQGKGGLRQWFKEKWVDEYGNECGSSKNKNTKKCRPSKRVSEDTPKTWSEMTSDEEKKAIKEKRKVGMGKKASPIKRKKTSKKSPKKTSKKSPKGSLKKSPKRLSKKMEGGVKVGKYYYKKSTRPGYKLMTVVDGKTIHFGKPGYEQYKDKTGIWASENHGDKERRKNYLTRAGGIRDKEGNLTKNDPKKANYHAMKVLW